MGEIFRKEREARGVSLEEIAADSKISIRFLRAIEKERFDVLPGGIFNRSFVRQYARYLGIEEENEVRKYLQNMDRKTENTVLPQPILGEVYEAPDRSRSFQLFLVLVCLGLLLGGIAYGLYRFRDSLFSWLTWRRAPVSVSLTQPPVSLPSPDNASLAADQTTGSSPARPDQATEPPPAESAAVVAIPESSSASPPAEAAVPGPLGDGVQLRIDSRAPVWLSITADGALQWQGNLPPNQSRLVQAADSVQLTVGDAAAVALTVNGTPMPSLGRSGEVRTITITAKGVSTPSP